MSSRSVRSGRFPATAVLPAFMFDVPAVAATASGTPVRSTSTGTIAAAQRPGGGARAKQEANRCSAAAGNTIATRSGRTAPTVTAPTRAPAGQPAGQPVHPPAGTAPPPCPRPQAPPPSATSAGTRTGVLLAPALRGMTAVRRRHRDSSVAGA